MLSSKQKVSILIGGAVILFAALIFTIFDLWPGRQEPGEEEEQPDLSFLEEEARGEGLTFDLNNKQEFAAFSGVVEEGEISSAQREARSLAEFFVTRSNTYSSSARFAFIEDLKAYMTDSLYDWFSQQRAQQPERSGFLAVVTEVAGIATKSFSQNQAGFELLARIRETSASGENTREQKVRVDLVREGNNWKVNAVFWGEG